MYIKDFNTLMWIFLIYICITISFGFILLKKMDANENAALDRDDRIMVACGYVLGNE